MRRFPLLFVSTALLFGQVTLDRAWDLLAKGQRQEAAAVARRLIEANPRNGEARLFLGSILVEDGSTVDGIAQLKEAVRLMPRSALAHNALGEALLGAGDNKSARPEFERAVALDPALSAAQASLGLILLQDGDAKAAAVHLDRAIRGFGDSPDSAQAHYLRAKIYTDSGEIEKAESELKKAVALAPDFAEAWSDLGQARKALLDDDGALAAFQRSVELAPANPIAQYRLGSEYQARGDTPKAEQHLRESYRLNPKNQSTLNALQMVLRENGNTAEADRVKKELSELLLEIDRESQSAFTALRLNNEGAALEKSGDLRAAIEKYRQAVALDPSHAGFHTNFGLALLRTGQWKEGLAELRDAARRDPENAFIRTALADALEQAPVEFGGKGKSRAAPKK